MKINIYLEKIVETRKKLILISIIGFFTLIYCSISLVNYYFFRVSAYDLGIYTNQLYHYLHFDLGNTVIYPNMTNKWADHFSVFQIIFSPLVYIFGSTTLLVVQIVFILFGGIGCYKIIQYMTKNDTLSIIGLCHFYSLWGIYSALSFDYHDNVIGAMIFPWLIYFFMKNQFYKASIALLSILLCKETMSLWMIFGGILLLFFSENRKQRAFSLVVTAFSILYFYVVFFHIIPSLNTGFSYKHVKYSYFGNSFADVGIYFFYHPLESIKFLFFNHIPDARFDYIKLEFWYMFILCGGFAAVRYPKFILAYLPLLFMKMYNDAYIKWGINLHYSIESVPIISVALFYFIKDLKVKFKVPTAFGILFITILLTMIKLNHRTSIWYDNSTAYFALASHYQNSTDVKKLHSIINEIGKNEKISATSALVPRLSFREHIYTFPYLGNSDKVLINTELNCFPMPKENLLPEIEKLKSSKNWKLTYSDGHNYIFERIGVNELHLETNYKFY